MKKEIIFELFEFLLVKKKWWLIPIVVFLLLLSFLLFLELYEISPFFYALF